MRVTFGDGAYDTYVGTLRQIAETGPLVGLTTIHGKTEGYLLAVRPVDGEMMAHLELNPVRSGYHWEPVANIAAVHVY